jgi:hypothetical protein
MTMMMKKKQEDVMMLPLLVSRCSPSSRHSGLRASPSLIMPPRLGSDEPPSPFGQLRWQPQ